ncbi:MAG: hypothetical protein JWM47_2019, partial [Acidimicrobiales bacterium]|nr:hypothetical protein [Acidimicrobiales bacterium]
MVVVLGACGSDPGDVAPATTSVPTSTTGPAQPAGPRDLAGVARPGADADLTEVDVRTEAVPGLDIPTALVPRPGTDDLYVAQRAGLVRILRSEPGGHVAVDDRPALDLTAQTTIDGNRGLLGLAFSASGDTLYASHTNTVGNVTVAAYEMAGDLAVPGSRRELLNVSMRFDDHNGGTLRLGDDGKLWFSIGDGGGVDDRDQRAQDPDDLRGKVLRLDPSGEAEPQVYALGLRNPWRFAFDRETGDLWLTDVGQEGAEEINYVPAGTPAGVNFGWSGYEGSNV